jgi:hypothetical protein
MTRGDYSATLAARRHVALGAAALLESAIASGDAWLYDEGDPDVADLRRRFKEVRQLVAKLCKASEKGGTK